MGPRRAKLGVAINRPGPVGVAHSRFAMTEIAPVHVKAYAHTSIAVDLLEGTKSVAAPASTAKLFVAAPHGRQGVHMVARRHLGVIPGFSGGYGILYYACDELLMLLWNIALVGIRLRDVKIRRYPGGFEAAG